MVVKEIGRNILGLLLLAPEMKKFYTNLGARELGNEGATTPWRMATLFDSLLYTFSERAHMKAKAIASTMIIGGFHKMGRRCEKVPQYM